MLHSEDVKDFGLDLLDGCELNVVEVKRLGAADGRGRSRCAVFNHNCHLLLYFLEAVHRAIVDET